MIEDEAVRITAYIEGGAKFAETELDEDPKTNGLQKSIITGTGVLRLVPTGEDTGDIESD